VTVTAAPPPDTTGSRSLRVRLLQAAVALALIGLVVHLAGAAQVLRLVRSTRPAGIAAAGALYLLVSVLRGARLAVLTSLPVGRAVLMSTAAQAAVQTVPVRMGELALPALLKRHSKVPLARGMGILLTVRALDLAGIGTWAGAAIGLHWGAERPVILAASIALVLPLVLLPTLAAIGDRLMVRCIAPRGHHGRRWARRARRLRSTLDELRGRSGRLAAAMLLTLVIWGGIWTIIRVLLWAIGFSWPLDVVIVGTSAATVATLVPVNVLGNIGTLEAGWTAGFAALGIPVETAAATGVAIHLWSLLVAVVFGIAAFLVLNHRRG